MHWWMLCTRAQEIPRLEKRLRVSAPRLVVQVGRRSRLQRHASAWERFLKTDSASVVIVDADVCCGFWGPAQGRLTKALATMQRLGRSCLFLGRRHPYAALPPDVGDEVAELPMCKDYSVGDYAVAYVITREGAAMLLREADKCCHDSVYVFIQSVLAQQACVLAIPFTFAQG